MTKENWQSRIVGQGEIDPRGIVANPDNWRIHPTHQRHALKDVMKQVGWVQQVVINKTTGHLIDGHLRVDLAIEEGEQAVPFIEVELSEQDERLILASLDPLASLAVADSEALSRLTEELNVEGEVLKGLLDDLVQAVGTPPDLPAADPDPADFWPRVSFQLPPNVYSEWRDLVEGLPGDADHEKIIQLLEMAKHGAQA